MAHQEYKPNPARRSGYILLVTLVLLALVSLSLVGITRLSLARAAAAQRAGRDLQRRWGTLSLCRAALEDAEATLAAEGDKGGRPVVSVVREKRLGGIAFQLLIGDEQAKANANALLAARPGPSARGDAERALRELVAGSPAASRSLRLRPVPGGELAGIGSPSQVFDDFDPAAFLPDLGAGGASLAGDGGGSAADAVTCWGDGRLNVWRATGPTLRAVASPPLTAAQVRKLVEARDAMLDGWRRDSAKGHGEGDDERSAPPPPPPTLAALLGRLDMTDRQRNGVARRLRDGSACHGVWVVARAGPQVWYTLAVREDSPDADGRGVTRTFEW